MTRYKLSDDPTDALRMAWAAHLGYSPDEDQPYGWPDDFDQFAAGWHARDEEIDRLRAALVEIAEADPWVEKSDIGRRNDIDIAKRALGIA